MSINFRVKKEIPKQSYTKVAPTLISVNMVPVGKFLFALGGIMTDMMVSSDLSGKISILISKKNKEQSFSVNVKAGDKFGMWYISANRDESVVVNPDKLIVDRENARRHLSFGYGIHRCVGARVAELQLTTLISEMQKRRLRVNVLGEPERVNACFVHGYRHMQVELEQY